MHFILATFFTLLVFHFHICFALSLQLSRVLPRFVKDVSSSVFSHTTYVDEIVHLNPRSVLNHEQWHHRHVVGFMNASSMAHMTLTAPTGYLGTISLGSPPASVSASANLSRTSTLISALPSASDSTNLSRTTSPPLPLPSAYDTTLKATRLSSLLGLTKDLEADKSADWDDQTESACSTALIALHGISTNPSGIAACYNIRNLVISTGIFEVDLRLYRISAPKEGWVKLDPSSVGVGLSYVNATVSATKEEKIKRDDQTLPWFPAQRDEAADIYIRRSTGAPPRRLESMTFVGTVNNDPLAELKDMTTALSLLTPAITLSGTEQDGTSINTRLSIQDAAFVTGVFASTMSKGSQLTTATDVNEFILPGTKLVSFPIGLIISSIWAVLYLMTMGYGTISRYRAREAYRQRVKHRFSGDAITKRKMRWA